MHVTPAEMSDVEAVADLWVRLAEDQRAHGAHLLPEENRAAVQEAIARHVVTDGVRVARDPEIVGFVMYDLVDGEYEQDRTRGIVRNLFVCEGRRDEGIGGELLSVAERELADAGADVVVLEALARNDAAIRFYERAGYRPHRIELAKPVESDTHSREDG
jgi:ribosomal protein S18 acetylase RimI-like enzyme